METPKLVTTFKKAPVNKEPKDYSNHPAVLKKLEEATAFIAKHGLPTEVMAQYKK